MPHREHVTPALELFSKGIPARLFGLDRDVVRIGRDSGSEVVIDDQRVSRSHARVLRRDDVYYVEDLESYNLTYLDDRPLPPNTPVPLRDGSRISICDHELVFRRAAIVIRTEKTGDSAVLKTLDEPGMRALETRPDRPAEGRVMRVVVSSAVHGRGL